MANAKELKSAFLDGLHKVLTQGANETTPSAAFFSVALAYLDKTGNLNQEDRPSIKETVRKLNLPFSSEQGKADLDNMRH